MFKVEENLNLKKQDLTAKVIGIYPAGQGPRQETEYQIEFCGHKIILSFSIIDSLFEKIKEEISEIKDTISDVVTPVVEPTVEPVVDPIVEPRVLETPVVSPSVEGER